MLNLKATLYARVWDVLLAKPGLAAVKPGNRIDSNDPNWYVRLATRRHPTSDFPNLAIIDTNGLPLQPMVVVDGRVPCVETFDVRLGYQRDGEALEAEIASAFFAQSANLGLDFVDSFTWNRHREAGETVYGFVVKCVPTVEQVT